MHLTVLLLFALTALGHFALIVISLNVIFHRNLREWLWNVLVAVHGGLLIAVPWVLWKTAYARPVRTGDLGSLPPLAWGYTGLALLALVYSIAHVLHAHAIRRPRVLASEHVERIDVSADLGRAPAGPGLRRAMAALPLNDLFELELAEKRLILPNLPPEWDGLSILHVTDVHLQGTPDRAFFERAMTLAMERWSPDLIALTGDVLDNPARRDWIASIFGPGSPPLGRYFVLGNHDALGDAGATRRALTDLGWVDVASRHLTVEHRGQSLLIAGTERPWMGTHPELPPADGAFRLVLSHSPHVINWARGHGVDLLLAGHLHGGQIRLPPIGALIGGRYASGTFHRPPTVLHVSKGLGSLTPLRFRCPPDVTLLRLGRGA